MSRYIDADGIQYTMLYKENWITNTGVEKQGVWKDDIDKIPTADVRKNVRGEWIDDGIHGDWAWEQDGHGNCWHIWKCSKCEYKTEHRSNYCPNCGAKMIGDNNV